MTEGEMEARTPRGKAIIAHALNEGGKTLDFRQEPDGTVIVQDVTEHVERLEEMAEEHNLNYDES